MGLVECLIGETKRRILHTIQVAGGVQPYLHRPPRRRQSKLTRRLAMAYGLSTRVFIKDGPAEQVSKLDAMRSTARSLRALNEAARLALIEQAVRAANDRFDAYPLAL